MVSITFISGLTTWLIVVMVLISLPEQSTAVEFNGSCNDSVLCNTTQDLDCLEVSGNLSQCKCKVNKYYNSEACTNNIENLKVTNLQAVTINQTAISINWTLPQHVSVVSRFEVLWTGKLVPVNLSSATTTYTIINLIPGTSYDVEVKSVESTSRLTDQKTSPATVNATTGYIVGFNNTCDGSSFVCNITKDLDCVTTTTQTKQCKCKTVNTYYHSATCINHPITNLKVTNQRASARSQTQLLVTWTLPTHYDSIDRIEVSTNPVTTTKVIKKPLTIQTALNGLQAGTTYTITIKSIDTTSRATEQATSVTTTGTTISVVDFNVVCSVSAVCDASKSLECVGQSTQTCKCNNGLYYYSGTCTNNYIANLKVSGLQVTAVSQTQIKVDWILPAHVSAINRFEVLWTDNANPVNLTSQVTTYTVNNLTPGKPYNVRVTSVDSTSRLTEQKVYPDEVRATTVALKGFDESCSSAVKCDVSKNLECNQKCKCKQNHYYDGTTCSNTLDNLKVRSPSAEADSQTQVTVSWLSPTASTAVNAIEISWTSIYGESQPKSISSSSTRTTISSLLGETDYMIKITSKDTTSGSTTISQSVNVNVKTKSALGGSCSYSVNCDGSYVECISKNCQCQANFYDNNNAAAGGTCRPNSELKVSNVKVAVLTTTSVYVTWTNPTTNSAIERKQVRWTKQDFNNVAVDATSTTIIGLTPGGSYTVTVISIDDNSRTSSQEVLSDAVPITTKPAIPGVIKSINPDNTGTQVTLTWIASIGVVTSYNVVFDDGNGDTKSQNTANNINSITMTSLTPGRRYNITITAISGSMRSDPSYGNTRTTVIVPGAPTNLRCISAMDTNVTLVWTPPVNPNGDIMYYSINITFGPGSPRTVNTTKPVKTQEIHQLTEDSHYSFTVRARNDLYDGPMSFSATCKTKPGLPSKPQNLSPVSVQSRSLTVGWMKPNSTKGSLIGYRIIVQNGSTCSKEILYQCSNCGKKPNLTSSCSVNFKTMVAITNTSLTNESFVQTIEGLFPYVSYSVLVNAITGGGDGHSGAVTVETKEEAPQNLTQVSADVLNSTAIKLRWNISDPRPGKTTYTIYLYDVIKEKQELNKSIEVLGFYERSTILTNLEEYWQYVIHIKASTNKGQNTMQTVTPEKTKPAAPGKVANFMVSRPERDYKSATITWSIPSLRDQNSLITRYEFKHNGTGTLASKTLSQSVNNEDGFTESIDVQPENYYYIEVYAINNENQTGVKSSELYYAPPGPPPKLDSSPDIKVIQNDIKIPPTETTATIVLYQNQLTADENGQIVANGIILCLEKTQVTTQRQYTDYNVFTTWKKAKIDGFKNCYKPTNSSWLQNTKKVTVRKRSTHEHISYTIGEDTTCDQKPENSYCNGPLNPGTSYKAYTFVCTKGGCTESQAIAITTVQPPAPIPFAIIGGVIGALVVIIIVLVVVIVLKKRKARKGNTHKKFDELKDFTDETETIQRHRPFQLQDCAAKVADLHKDANLKFAAEYEDIKTLSPKHPTEAAEMDQNRLKNRYVNILPFDHSRVKLLPIDDDESTDFINANYLPGYNSPREYIGTQGPIPGTIDDFWRMVWEQNVGIIVMLTLLKEEGRIKCEEYWPMERNDPKQYGELVVETTSYSTVNFYDFRIFKIKLGDKVRTVKHFHFLNWKDFSANVQNDVMIDFIQNVRSHVQPPDKEGPMIVHCSAGVGRTGTYICLDHLMQLINEHDLNTAIDIFDLVLKLRDNRSFMVQTEQQYVFIHDCVKDMIEKKKLALQDQGDEDLYMNQDENLYENRAFEAEENLYQNVDTRTDL